MEDKRNYPRLGTIWGLAYRPIDTEEIQEELLRGVTVNVSTGGIRFEADEQIPEETVLALEMDAPVFTSQIIAVGKVIWCRKNEKEDRYDVGVEFMWMGWQDLDVQQALTEYITDHDF